MRHHHRLGLGLQQNNPLSEAERQMTSSKSHCLPSVIAWGRKTDFHASQLELEMSNTFRARGTWLLLWFKSLSAPLVVLREAAIAARALSRVHSWPGLALVVLSFTSR